MSKLENLEGKRFGRLVVIERVSPKNGITRWKCRCDCGKESIVYRGDLVRGRIVSCGCYNVEKQTGENSWKYKHGKSHSRIYRCWEHMKQRCSEKAEPRIYKDYKGRGIFVCEEWEKSFENFLKWAFDNGYNDKLTLDRIDNDGPYAPWNCRWATMKEQRRNTRQNKYITYNGETKCLTDWSISTGISKHILSYRYNLGWDAERILNTPVQKRKNSTTTKQLSIPQENVQKDCSQ